MSDFKITENCAWQMSDKAEKPQKFYLSFGSDHIFHGGYAIVYAYSIDQALNLFAVKHNMQDYLENPVLVHLCCNIYSERAWQETSMSKTGLNLGKGLQETLAMYAESAESEV